MPRDLLNLFVCNIKKLSAKENCYSLTNNSRKFQESVTQRCISVSKRSGMFWQNLLKASVKKLNLQNPLLQMDFFTSDF